ncbi:MAG TPA: type II toxin-antitoxin system RelE/ParE family toxin [Nitrococcus sp.]|nr:type II toxin-antitoxin system RelE/ParE family toxin [Nitrococcus sp.]
MLTVVETELFSRLVRDYWSEDERQAFAAYLATHPDIGEVVPHSGGVRKVRWGRKGMGKRGGIRVIYFNRLDNGEIWLLLIYAKSANDNIPAQVLRELKEELENG